MLKTGEAVLSFSLRLLMQQEWKQRSSWPEDRSSHAVGMVEAAAGVCEAGARLIYPVSFAYRICGSWKKRMLVRSFRLQL